MSKYGRWHLAMVIVLTIYFVTGVVIPFRFFGQGTESLPGGPVSGTVALILAFVYYVSKWFLLARWTGEYTYNAIFAMLITVFTTVAASVPASFAQIPGALDPPNWWISSFLGGMVLMIFVGVEIVFTILGRANPFDVENAYTTANQDAFVAADRLDIDT